MLSPELLAIFYGLASAFSWGTSDFSGGLATKKNNVYAVVIFSQGIGLLFILLLLIFLREPLLTSRDLFWSVLAGASGAWALLALYAGLAQGRMGVVAPVSAVVTATIPIIFSFFVEGIPPAAKLSGFLLALGAVWFLAQSEYGYQLELSQLRLPVLAGMGFAGFFITIDQVTTGAVLWPLVVARCTAVPILLIYILSKQRWQVPARAQMHLVLFSGVLDVGGTGFFILAAQSGRLDVAAVVSSLFPATTILLARFFLGERLSRRQQLGVWAAIVALLLIAL
jgi:drug/metabolite transporter (DMT)-like permease